MHLQMTSDLVDGSVLLIRLHQCATTKQYVVTSMRSDPVAANEEPRYQRQWLAQYNNPHDAMQRYTLAVVDECRRNGMRTTRWEQQLVNDEAVTPRAHYESWVGNPNAPEDNR